MPGIGVSRGVPVEMKAVLNARSGIAAKSLEQAALVGSALEFAPDPVALVIRRGDGAPPVISYVNRAFGELFGYAPAALVGRSPSVLRGTRTAGDPFALAGLDVAIPRPDAETDYLYTSSGEERLVEIRERAINESHALVSVHDLTRVRETLDALLEANQRLGSFLANNTEAVLTLDVAGSCLDVNTAAKKLFGLEREELIGLGFRSGAKHGLFPGDEPFPEPLRAGRTMQYGAVFHHRDGRRLKVECKAVPMIVAGTTQGAYVIARDVTESTRLANLVSEQAKRTHALYLISAAKGTTNAKQIDEALGLVLDCFEMQYAFLCEVRGEEMHLLNVVGHGLIEVGDVFPLRKTRVAEMLKFGDVYAVDDTDLPQNRLEGVPHYAGWHAYISAPLIIAGAVYGAIGFVSTRVVPFNDYDKDFVRLAAALVSAAIERQMQRDRLDALAYLDILTELPNRAKFMLDIEAAIASARQGVRSFALHFMDLDGFKNINDRAGHSVGDLALKEVARRLRALPRLSDVPARLGGDEFVLLQQNVANVAQARALGRRIIASLSEPYVLEGQPYELGASVGIAIYPRDGREARTLLQSADLALYRAKAAGKNRAELSVSSYAET